MDKGGHWLRDGFRQRLRRLETHQMRRTCKEMGGLFNETADDDWGDRDFAIAPASPPQRCGAKRIQAACPVPPA